MLQDLDRLVEVDVPDYDQAISADREEVVTRGILGTPIYFEDVRLVEVVPLLERLGTQKWNLLWPHLIAKLSLSLLLVQRIV